MRAVAFLAVVVMPGMGWAWEEPQRGTDTRSALMDALRPHVE